MTKAQQTPGVWQTPKKMPHSLEALDRAIMLLGSMLKTELRLKARQDLVELLGCLPEPQMAPVWKLALKRRRKALVEQPDDNIQQPSQPNEPSP
jgi:hypothetical protein